MSKDTIPDVSVLMFVSVFLLTGAEQLLGVTNCLVDTSSSTVLTETFHHEGNIAVSAPSLNNGER